MARFLRAVRRVAAVCATVERVLDPPAPAIVEPEPTVSDRLARRLTIADAERTRVEALLADLAARCAAQEARLEHMRQEDFEAHPEIN